MTCLGCVAGSSALFSPLCSCLRCTFPPLPMSSRRAQMHQFLVFCLQNIATGTATSVWWRASWRTFITVSYIDFLISQGYDMTWKICLVVLVAGMASWCEGLLTISSWVTVSWDQGIFTNVSSILLMLQLRYSLTWFLTYICLAVKSSLKTSIKLSWFTY